MWILAVIAFIVIAVWMVKHDVTRRPTPGKRKTRRNIEDIRNSAKR